MAGTFVVVFGPTGVGKGTLVRHIRDMFPVLIFPHTQTTRAKRPGEEEGTLYDFVSVDEFKKNIDAGIFVEWAEFSGNLYGTPRGPIQQAIHEGNIALKELEIQGVRQLIQKIPRENLFIIYIDAGPWEHLERRIRARAPITDEEVANRKRRYQDESASKDLADIQIHNVDGKLEEAKTEFETIIRSLL